MSLIVWVRQWVANIIALIFLSTLLELLLPRGNLQRYVRVVMGLLVMLAILQPVFSLMAQGFGLDGLRAAMTGDRGIDVDRILADAERMRERNSDLTRETYRRQVERSMAERLARLPGVRSVSCLVELAPDAGGGSGAIASVTVTLVPGEHAGTSTTGPDAVQPVAPVTPVVIGQGGQTDPSAAKPRPQLGEELRGLVVRTLVAEYALAPDQITVVAGGS